jgi:hypothetical protein
MERERFEDSWKEPFKDAEISPSDSLWTNIELDLEKENSGKMKRRIMFFQLLAAASVAFAMTFAGVGIYFMMNNDGQGQLATRTNQIKSATPKTSTQPLPGSDNANPATTTDNTLATDQAAGIARAATGNTPGETTTAEATNSGKDDSAAYGPARPASPAQATANASRISPASDHRANPLSHQIAATATDNASAANRITSRSDRTVVSSNTAHPASGLVTATSGGNTPALNRVARVPNQATSASNRVASTSGQAAPALNRVAAATGEATSTSGHVAVVSDQVTGVSNRTASAPDQTAPVDKVTDPSTKQTAFAPNPFTSAVVAASPEERALSTMRGPLPSIAHPSEPSLATISRQEPGDADPVALMLARLEDKEKQYATEEKENKKKDKGNERLWTTVGMSAGAYNMVTSGNASASNNALGNQLSLSGNSNGDLAKDIVRKQSSASGTAYSVGLNLGTRLAARWVLQGGVNYLTQSSGYTTNAAVSTPDNAQYALASIDELSKISNNAGRQGDKVIPTAEYRVNSSLSYLSVPLQAGYLVVNRAFGLQFNAGVSTDLFVKNTLTPDGGTLQKSTQTRSDDTPYRPLNFSGLVGTEFSYRFGQHYRLALNPGLRYPFSSIYKSDIAVSAIPLTFDVGLKFRYIFH